MKVKKLNYFILIFLVGFATGISKCENRDPRYGAMLFKQSEMSLESVYGEAVQKTDDGSIIVAGPGGGSLWLAKIDSDSDVLWEKQYDTGGNEAFIYNTQMVTTFDNHYVIATVLANSAYGNNSFDLWLLKLDTSGNIIWEKTYPTENNFFVGALLETDEGDYLISGETEFEGGIYKVDSAGSIIWNKQYSGLGKINALKDLGNGLYMAAGASTIMTFDKEGAVQQSASFEVIDQTIEINEADLTPDGGYILTGDISTWTGKSGSNIIIIKLDSGLNLVWKKVIDLNSADDRAAYIETTSDGGAILTGLGWAGVPVLSNLDVFCMKLSRSGSIEWNTFYDLGVRGVEQGFMIRETADGYIVSGNVSTQGFVMGIDRAGNIPGSDISKRSGNISEANCVLSINRPTIDVTNAIASEKVTRAEVLDINSKITKL